MLGSLFAASVPIACGSHTVTTAVTCQRDSDGCSCEAFESSTSPPPPACDTTAFPGTTCCADPGWPSPTTSCACRTGDTYCGIVKGYFTDGSDGCVCALFPPTPGAATGLTCYPGGSTTQSSLGVCCKFPNGDCACGSGLHTCGGGGAPVSTCSAANFPPKSSTCSGGRTTVASCATGTGGPPTDAGSQPESDVVSFGSCTSNADCDPQYQFCEKATCDAATGTCVERPGQAQTFFCSPADGGGQVCGCDGATWPYACIANAEGVNVASEGPCPSADAAAE